MIKNYKNLTVKYLKSNKKRSILTIVGIVLSVALISTIGFFIVGIQNAEIESIKNDYGSWHVMYQAPDDDLIAKVNSNPKVSRSGIFEMDKQVKVDKNISISPIKATGKALELLPYQIESGRLPQNNNEIAIENWVIGYMGKDVRLGNQIKLKGREYKLVGVLKNTVSSQKEKSGIFLSKVNNIDKSKSALIAEISSKTNLKKAVSELNALPKSKNVKINGKYTASVVNNSPLIDMEGGGDGNSGLSQIYGSIAVIIGIVVIATIAVIYNSFQISVVERIKQFGLLQAIGMTPSQIRKMVFREASILSIIGIPLGVLLGIIAIYIIQIVFKAIGGDSVMHIKLAISPKVMIISAAVALVSIYLSAFLPALFAGRISPLVAINGRTSITKEKIKRRKNTIVKRLFGFEGDLAYKNIKRNRRRYRITVFSIVISVVLFITFKSFMDMTLNVSDNLNESKNIHFSVVMDSNVSSKNSTINPGIINDISKLNTVQKVYKVYDNYKFNEFIDPQNGISEIRDLGSIYKDVSLNGYNKILMTGGLDVYDNNSLKSARKYIKSGSIDIGKLNNENGIILIEKNRIVNEKTDKQRYGKIADIKVGDKIELQFNKQTDLKVNNSKINKVTVMAILKDDPFDFWGVQNGLKIITTENVAKKLMSNSNLNVNSLNIVLKNINDENRAKEQIQNITKSIPSITVIDQLDQNRSTKSSILIVKILIYGFVVIVSIIGSINIVNTLTTNIILRKREFAALKSIGLTQRGLKKMITLEGLLYAVVGTIYGSIISCGLSYMIYRGISGIRESTWPVPWSGMIIAAAAAVIIGYISTLSPLSRINRENIIDTIRQDY
ncbi:ABC transporter permease [Clostridium tyrobutyricum]|uniref:ABC transporter permease n=1 Tax=Clostridium tyrobutyricum TaxID=1519 RepID=UPI001C385247|nr:ABC transporter permease [Clostridium tyrobutyricum]MBV4425977.1 ABC transporter permease [Clostridium tyrobutyricum]